MIQSLSMSDVCRLPPRRRGRLIDVEALSVSGLRTNAPNYHQGTRETRFLETGLCMAFKQLRLFWDARVNSSFGKMVAVA